MFQTLAKTIRFFVFAILLIAVVLFAMANRQQIPISLNPLPWEVSTPLFLVVLLSIIVGYLLSSLSGMTQRFKLRHENRQQHKKLKALEQEVAALKTEHIHQPTPSTDVAAQATPPQLSV